MIIGWEKPRQGLLFFTAWLCGGVFVHAFSGSDSYSMIPGAGVLPQNSYQIFGQMNVHNARILNTTDMHFPWSIGARLGLFGHAELAMEFGSELSLAAKLNLIEQEEWRPRWSMGVRQLFHSQEAHLLSVPDSLQGPYIGEAFTVISYRFFNGTRLDVGASVLSGVDSGKAGGFWGLEQGLGAGLSLVYDGFWRQGLHHHNLGVAWDFRKVLRLSVGATEVYRYFRQNDEFGFYFSDRENRSADGYSAPGIWAAISLTGWMGESSSKGLESRLAEQEKSRVLQLRRIDSLEVQFDRVQTLLEAQAVKGGDSLTVLENKAEALLEELVKGLHNEAWDPAESRRLQDSLLAMGNISKRLMVRMVRRESTSLEYRVAAVRIMGTGKDEMFVPVLSAMLSEKNPVLVRECLFALAHIGTPDALEIIRKSKATLSPELQSVAEGLLVTP